jgi:hypothetical protein
MAALTTPTAASVIPSASASIQSGTAGGTITIGKPVYVDTANGNVIKEANADSTGSSTAATVAGVALCSVAINQKVFYAASDTAFAHGFTVSEIAPGDIVLLDDTTGAYTVTPGDLTAGDWVCYVGQINNPETTMNLAPKAPILKA